MCGIMGAVSYRSVLPSLLEGLKRLEYRGYDSAGIVVIDANQHFQLRRIAGKVQKLVELIQLDPMSGLTGLAHTRWATHGKPSERNAHPHIANNEIAIVHNGIIENHEILRTQLLDAGCILTSDTDSELVAHLIYRYMQTGQDFLSAVRTLVTEIKGTFSIAFIHNSEPGRIIALRSGSPLVIGLGDNENFIASDKMALASVTKRFIYLEEGDIADIRQQQVTLYDTNGVQVTRAIHTSEYLQQAICKDPYPHFMLKEIMEQPDTLSDVLEGRIAQDHILVESFGSEARTIFSRIKRVLIVACGTSYHAGLVGRNWIEALAGLPCQVEIASENRYRIAIVEPDTLFVTLSQSGETADTLAACRYAKQLGYAATLAICNVPDSALCRESDLVFMTHAGTEIGVASTKSFTSQLVALFLLTIALGRTHRMSSEMETDLINHLKTLPEGAHQALKLDEPIKQLANNFINVQNVIFLGRGNQYPIALEAALKLKEIGYIHADAYPAGELKHGSLALVDASLHVIALAPTTDLLSKLKSNLQEVLARNGKLIVFTDNQSDIINSTEQRVLTLPTVDPLIAPIIYAIPMQLFAYHVGVLKGIDVDQPRNLAKSVTVE